MLRTVTLTFTVLISAFLLSTAALAQLDPSFGTNGRTVRSAPGMQSPIRTFMLPDGKVLVLMIERVGSTSFDPLTYSFVRFNSNGTVDTSYGTNGAAQVQIPFTGAVNDYMIMDAVRQPDGKIVLVGWNVDDGLIVRVNEDGTLDPGFSGDGVHRPNINQVGEDILTNVLIQPDGKIVVVGSTRINNVDSLFLIRYEANGGLDFVFGNQGGFIVHGVGSLGAGVTGLGRQSDGRYVVLTGGYSNGVQNLGRAYRFNTDGTLDSSFASPTFGNGDAARLIVLPDDRLIVQGFLYYTDALLRSQGDIRLTRLTSTGATDPTFGNGGTVILDMVPGMTDQFGDIIRLQDGTIGVATSTLVQKNRSAVSGWHLSVMTVGSNGALTGLYLATELGAGGLAWNLVQQADGKLVAAASYGDGATSDILVARLTSVPLNTYRFHGIPFEFLTGPSGGPLGISHPAVFRPSNTKWYAAPYLAAGAQFGLPTDTLAAGDFFGDYQAELAVFRPSNGTWYVSKNYSSTDFATIQWGANGDIPAAYDYDGDGKYDVTVFRPSDGNWYIRQSSGGVQIHHWGITGDKPVIGDYDGDGLGDLAVWRPSTGVWYIHRSSDGQAMIAGFGLDGDIPIQEDYDGDLKTDIGVFRPSTGVWYIWRSSDNGFTIVPFGTASDVPVPADYDGDRKMDIAVYRPSTSRWYRIESGSGTTAEFTWGIPGDVAVEGRY